MEVNIDQNYAILHNQECAKTTSFWIIVYKVNIDQSIYQVLLFYINNIIVL